MYLFVSLMSDVETKCLLYETVWDLPDQLSDFSETV